MSDPIGQNFENRIWVRQYLKPDPESTETPGFSRILIHNLA